MLRFITLATRTLTSFLLRKAQTHSDSESQKTRHKTGSIGYCMPDLDGVPVIDFLVYRVVLCGRLIALDCVLTGCYGFFCFSLDHFS